MKERPILVAVIGYIIGILGGLYFQFSIVPCYILILAIYYILKTGFKNRKRNEFRLFSFRRYSKYLKLIINRKVIFILIILSSISNTIVLYQNNQYQKIYQEGKNIQVTGIVVSQKIEKTYYNLYQIKLLDSKPFNLYIQVSKKSEELAYGDKVKVQGEYKKPSKQRNYGGYDEQQYLKTLKIVGKVKVKELEVIAHKQLSTPLQVANEVKKKIKERIEANFEEENSAILKGLLLGETSEIQEEVKKNFQISSISHVLAISGLHISYIVIGIQILFKRVIGKKKTKIFTIIFLIFYCCITGFSPSIVRATVMAIITIGAEIVYRKSDIGNSIAISLFIILLYNPYLILQVGLQLSYLGTIGIILFSPSIRKVFNIIKLKKKRRIIEKIKEMLAVTLSAQIMIFPILIYHFNLIGVYFLLTNLLVSLVIGPIIILGFFSIGIKLFVIPVRIGLAYLHLIALFSQLPFSKIYMATPSILLIIFYFVILWIASQIYFIYHLNHLTPTQKRVKNIIALFRYQFRKKKKRYLKYMMILLMFILVISLLPKKLKIYFVDVGQGDGTFIVTPKNKTILIDGGGSLTDEFDVGDKILIPYLLDRGYTTIDYIIISHFDQDHVRLYPIFVTRNKSEKCDYRKAI